MNQDWAVEGTVTYTDSSVAAYDAFWEGLTLDEADAEVERIVAEYIRKRKVHGISVRATTQGEHGLAVIIRTESK